MEANQPRRTCRALSPAWRLAGKATNEATNEATIEDEVVFAGPESVRRTNLLEAFSVVYGQKTRPESWSQEVLHKYGAGRGAKFCVS